MPNIRTPLDQLDERFRDSQERLADALRSDDVDAVADIRAEAGSVSVIDADGLEWRVNAPRDSGAVTPFLRFHYRYWAAKPGGDLRPIERRQFAPAPSLAKTYADELGEKGWMPAVIRNAEPLGYVGVGAVGIGLWFLLGDIIGSLPGWSVLVGMILLAAGLWLSTVRLTTIGYREALRLGHVTRAAAVGVTGSIPWVATIDASWITTTGRVAITAYVVTVAAMLSYLRTPSILTYWIGLVSWVVALSATCSILVLEISPDSIGGLGAQLGVLIALAVAFPIVSMYASVRLIPLSVVGLAGVAVIAILMSTTDELTTAEAFYGVLAGAVVAATSWTSRGYLRPSMRRFHELSAAAIAAVVVLVALARMPWDFLEAFFDWLADVPLPILLISAGSLLLIGIAWVVRLAVRRLGTSSPDNE